VAYCILALRAVEQGIVVRNHGYYDQPPDMLGILCCTRRIPTRTSWAMGFFTAVLTVFKKLSSLAKEYTRFCALAQEIFAMQRRWT
jgi:hypothetical protein